MKMHQLETAHMTLIMAEHELHASSSEALAQEEQSVSDQEEAMLHIKKLSEETRRQTSQNN